MRFLLRLLLLLVLSSFLSRHYGFFLRENLWHVQSAGNGELLNRLPGITKDHPQGDWRKRTCRLECCRATT